jgi:hypothetical protein
MTSLNQSENIALTAVDSSDSESDDELSQNHKKKKPIESKSTIDTTEPMQLGEFIEMVQKSEVAEGKALFDLISTLPKLNSKLGLSQTFGRAVSYLKGALI